MPKAQPFARTVVERAFVTLANGVAADLHGRGLLHNTNDQCETIFQTAQAVLFKILFLLFAESRHLLPLTHTVYARHSIHRLLEEIAAQPLLNERDFWAWDWLQTLLAATRAGQPDWGVPRCGDIVTSTLAGVRIHTRYLSHALDVLGYDQATRQLRDYATVDVRVLGEIYERLLACKLVQRPGAGIDERRKTKDESTHASLSLHEADALPILVLQHTHVERRASGSFYTPQHLVSALVEQTIGPLLAERIVRFEAEPTAVIGAALLDLTVLDPAMGCGTFLLTTVDLIVERLRGLSVYDGYDVRALRHMVLQRCIYGVDIDTEAVAVARLSLWLDCCLVGTPLDALNRHIRCGNSLIGGWLHTSDDHIPPDLQAGLQLLHDALPSDDRHATDVAYKRLIAPSTLLLDEDVTQKLYCGAQSTSDRVHVLAEQHRFLHWELAFPTIFFDIAHESRKPPDQAGFDVVIGNPPYVTTLDQQERAYLAAWSTTRGRELDACYLFVEQALRLLLPGGRCGMVMPSVWTTQSEAEPFRRYLLDQTLLNLHDLGFNVFGAAVPVATFVLALSTPATDHLVVMHMRNDSERAVLQSVFKSLPGVQFNLDLVEMLPLLQRVEAVSAPLATYAESHEGVHSGNIRHKLFTRILGQASKPMLKGADISRYSLMWGGWYVNYDPTLIDRAAGEYASLRDQRIFTQSKIWTRQTGDSIIATCDAQDFYSDNTLHATQLRPGVQLSPLYLVALLNSRLLTFIYQRRTQERGRPLAQVKLVFLRQLPIRRITFSTPQAQRARLVAEGIALAAAWVERAQSGILADLHKSGIGAWMEARVGRENTNESDAVHDLLAVLAGQMLDLKRHQQSEIRTFLDWLAAETRSDISAWKGKTIAQTYWAQPWERVDLTLRRNISEIMLGPLRTMIQTRWEVSCAALAPLGVATRATDQLIDRLVYRLYELDDGEIVVIEADSRH